MQHRERVISILNNEPVDRIPVDMWATPEVIVCLKEYFDEQDETELYKKMNLDKIVWVFPEYKQTPEGVGLGSQVGTRVAGARTMWGVPLREVKSGKATYHEFSEPPLKGYETTKSLDDYPYWPDSEKFDYNSAAEKAKLVSAYFVTIGPWVSFFEIYCQMRGLEQALMDIVLNPQLVEGILDKIEQCQTEMMTKFFDKAAKYIDLCFISDDMGQQQGLLISPQLWENFFKKRMERWCDLIHSYDIKVFYHTDGACEPLIGPLIDCGIDMLNPIQHVCAGMEMNNLKAKYGHRIVFHGGVDNQSVLPFGNPDDVRRETQDCLKTLGRDRKGYIVCSCHNIQAGTPVENIMAMIETVINSN